MRRCVLFCEISPQSYLNNQQMIGSTSKFLWKLFVCAWIAFAVVLLLSLCRYGFDITDGGFYLITINNPYAYSDTSTQFGFILHALWRLIDQDIVALRRVNVVVLYMLGYWLFYLSLDSICVTDRIAKSSRILLSALLAFTVFCVFFYWLPTPNYNSLNLIGLLIASIGLLYVNSPEQNRNIAGFILLGCGGWLVFMSKPTSAVALAIVVALYSLKLAKIERSGLSIVNGLLIAIAVATILLLISAFIIGGSLPDFIQNLINGMAHGEVLFGKKWSSFSDVFWRGNFNFQAISATTIVIPLTIGGLLAVQVNSSWKEGRLVNRFSSITCYVLTCLVFFWLVAIFQEWLPNPMVSLTLEQRFLVVFLPVFSFLVIVVGLRLFDRQHHWHSRIPLSLTILLMPYVYTVGTGNNYMASMLLVPIFGFVGIILIFSGAGAKSAQSSLWLISCAGFTLAMMSLPLGEKLPYRQAKFPEMTTILGIGSQPGYVNQSSGSLKGLRLPNDVHEYLSSIKNQAQTSGFNQFTAVIDMTGGSPGTVFAIGGTSLGAAWMIGGYTGSERYGLKVLKNVPNSELQTAWVLVEKEGPRKFSDNFLLLLGKSLECDYTLVARAWVPAGYGGRYLRVEQLLYKPKPDLLNKK